MTVQPDTTAMSTPSVCTTPESSAAKVSVLHKAQNDAENPTVLRPDDDNATKRLERDAEHRTLFERLCNTKLGMPNGYKQVEVLLIRWDESIDDFKVGHSQEASSSSLYLVDCSY
jgi:hypothetical protein